MVTVKLVTQMTERLVWLVGLLVVLSLATVQAKEVSSLYQDNCAACHDASAAAESGAPAVGDKSAWAARLKKGMPALLTSVKGGQGRMPARGLCNDCSDDDYKALIQYMTK